MKASEYKKMRDEFLKITLELSDSKRIEYTEGNHKDIRSLIEATKVQSGGTFSDQEVIEFLLKNNWITRN